MSLKPWLDIHITTTASYFARIWGGRVGFGIKKHTSTRQTSMCDAAKPRQVQRLIKKCISTLKDLLSSKLRPTVTLGAKRHHHVGTIITQ